MDLTPVELTANMSLAAGVLTILALCIAIVPVPFTGYVCFPTAGTLSVVSIVTGLRALHLTRVKGSKGRGRAVAGLVMGSGALIAALCSAVVMLLFWSHLVEVFRQIAD